VDLFDRGLDRCGHRAIEHSHRYAARTDVRGPLQRFGSSCFTQLNRHGVGKLT